MLTSILEYAAVVCGLLISFCIAIAGIVLIIIGGFELSIAITWEAFGYILGGLTTLCFAFLFAIFITLILDE